MKKFELKDINLNNQGRVNCYNTKLFISYLKLGKVKHLRYNKGLQQYELFNTHFVPQSDMKASVDEPETSNIYELDILYGRFLRYLWRTVEYTCLTIYMDNMDKSTRLEYFIVENTESMRKTMKSALKGSEKYNQIITYQTTWINDLEQTFKESILFYVNDRANTWDFTKMTGENYLDLFMHSMDRTKKPVKTAQELRNDMNKLSDIEQKEVIEAAKKVLPSDMIDKAVNSIMHPFPQELEHQKNKLAACKEAYQRAMEKVGEKATITENRRQRLRRQTMIVSAMQAPIKFKFDMADEMGYAKFRLRIKYNFSEMKLINRRTTQYINAVFHSKAFKKDLFLFDSFINTQSNTEEELVFTCNTKERNQLVKLYEYISLELHRGINFFDTEDFDIIG